MDLPLQLGETDGLEEHLLEVLGSGCGRNWRAMLLGTHPSFSSEFFFSLKLSDALTPPQPCLFACFAVRLHGVLEIHNEMGVVSEQTSIELTLSPVPSAHQESREKNIIVGGQNGIN